MIERNYQPDTSATTYTVDGVELPSVSTIVGRMHSYGVERYKQRNVADTAKAYPNLESDAIIAIASKDGGDAARHGQHVHSALDSLQFDGKPTIVDPLTAPAIEFWEALQASHNLKFFAAEKLVCVPGKYSGRFDRAMLTETDGLVIVDFKTSAVNSLEYLIQLFAYANATHWVNEETGKSEPITDGFNRKVGYIVRIPRNGTASGLYRYDLTRVGQQWENLLRQYEWEIGFNGKDNKPWRNVTKREPVMTVAEIAKELGGELINALDHYQDTSWAYLHSLLGSYTPEMRKSLAEIWPKADEELGLEAVPTFKQVREGAPIPSLWQIQRLEQAMVNVDSFHAVKFRDVQARPLPPKGATMEEAPATIIRMDTPSMTDLAGMYALYARCSPSQRSHYTGIVKSTRPHAATRTDMYTNIAELEAILANPALEKPKKTTKPTTEKAEPK